jgi:ornithine decarboxylase
MLVEYQDYYSESDWELFKSDADKHETPFLLVNLEIIRRKYLELQKYFPYANIYYAIKSNPAIEVLELLRDLGSCFDVASVYELDRVLQIGVSPDRLSYGNTIKKLADIKYFYDKGVRLFATDSEADVKKLAQAAPGSKIFCRILTEGSDTADWPLSRKFGCHPDMAIDLILQAKKLGLIPYGISFHVGSQQRDIGAWDSAIAKVRYIFDFLAEEGVTLKLINLGGGFPANYVVKTNSMEAYSEEITRYLREDFGNELPQIILEPGRSLVGEAGVIVSEVILVSRKARINVDRWVYVDVGKFNGLVETWDESIKYPIYCERRSSNHGNVILAGPTCDSQDIMYEKYVYKMPMNLAVGDRLYWLSTGAYTTSYCSVEFNGFPPLKTYFVK